MLIAQLSTAFAQGPPTPPGTPAPTMKTLAQVVADDNTGNGIYASADGNRIDGNHTANNDARGIKLYSPNTSIVIRNTASANGGGDFPVPGSNIGLIQSPSTATSPWANFSFQP